MNKVEGYFTQHDDILENKLGITDPIEMKQVESDVVALRMTELFAEPPQDEMDYAYLKQIHARLFGDLYYMAGLTRTVDIAKGENAFCYTQFIDAEQKRIFKEARSRFKIDFTTKELLAQALAWLSSELNALHPFREGNGRAIRSFLVILAQRKGYHMDFSLVDDARRMAADIAAFSGNTQPLEQVYNDMLTIDSHL